jgi:phage portal protein, SPP1 family
MNHLLSQKFNIDLFLAQMAAMSGIITSSMLFDLWTQSLLRRQNEIGMKQRYAGQGLPIQARTMPEHTDINNKIVNDFRGDIVDTFTGYLLGSPVKYTIKPERYDNGQDDAQFKKDTEFFDNFVSINQFDDVDLETAKNQSICGRGARLCYVGTDKTDLNYPNYRVIDIDPAECVFIYNPSNNELEYAVRFYTIYDTDSHGELKPKIQVEFYDKQYVHYYISTGDEVKSFSKNKESQLHNFNYVPLFEVENNSERLGDFEKVETLIDAYDKSISDSQNEIEAFRLAYLVLSGARMSDKDLKAARQSGLFQILQGEKLEYLTKSVDGNFVNAHLDRVTKNIYRFSKTVDTSSETFTGVGASGEARKWTLLSLENKGTIKINKFKKALNYQFKVLASAWSKIGISITAEKLSIAFDRNIPVELTSEATTARTLKGIVSDRTIFELLSFVPNPDDEMVRIQDENKELALSFEEDDDNHNSDEKDVSHETN